MMKNNDFEFPFPYPTLAVERHGQMVIKVSMNFIDHGKRGSAIKNKIEAGKMQTSIETKM